jgi:hypothetical protein
VHRRRRRRRRRSRVVSVFPRRQSLVSISSRWYHRHSMVP